MSTHRTWHFGRSEALVTISGSETLEGFWDAVAAGQWVLVEVDHSDEAEFAWAEGVRVSPVDGAVFVEVASGRNGGGFGLMVWREEDSGYQTGDLVFEWERKGGLV